VPDETIHVLVVAAYASVRAGLAVLLAEEGGFAVVAEVNGSRELEHILSNTEPDVVLVDSAPGDRSAILELLAQATLPAVVLTDEGESPSPVWNRLVWGRGLLSRSAYGDTIRAALRAAAAGLVVVDEFHAAAATTPPARAVSHDSADDPEPSLTPREHEVLQMLALGLPNKVIANRLSISLHTIVPPVVKTAGALF
jgi:DNA-binding NarL/FixJ family response regulator